MRCQVSVTGSVGLPADVFCPVSGESGLDQEKITWHRMQHALDHAGMSDRRPPGHPLRLCWTNGKSATAESETIAGSRRTQAVHISG